MTTARVRGLAVIAAVLFLTTFPASSYGADDPTAPSPTSVPLNFQPPKDWTELTRAVDRPGLWRDWIYRDGAVVHSIVLSVTREDRLAAPYAEATIASLKARAGVSEVTGGRATTCGDVPAYAYAYRTDRTPGHPLIIMHLVVDVGSFIGDVSYAHPPDAANRPEALEAMSTLCARRPSAATPAPS